MKLRVAKSNLLKSSLTLIFLILILIYYIIIILYILLLLLDVNYKKLHCSCIIIVHSRLLLLPLLQLYMRNNTQSHRVLIKKQKHHNKSK
jgi:hypothetical protein